jgi:hypothetical protein
MLKDLLGEGVSYDRFFARFHSNIVRPKTGDLERRM